MGSIGVEGKEVEKRRRVEMGGEGMGVGRICCGQVHLFPGPPICTELHRFTLMTWPSTANLINDLHPQAYPSDCN